MKKIYILPNLFTTANFFCGILALSWILQGNYVPAAYVIILAMVFDLIDGQVARLYRATSRFGVEYDSLADFLTFGIATTLLAYRLALSDMGRIGIGIAFLYAVFCALRLARFNTQVKKEEKTDFIGLPSPISAGILVSYIILISRHDLRGWEKAIPFLMIILSYLMISTYTYPSLLSLQAKKKRPFLYLVFSILALVLLIFMPPLMLLLGFLAYMGFGLLRAYQARSRKRASQEEVFSPEARTESD